MRVEELISTHPRLYHMAETTAWAGISRHGLLSAEAIVDLFEVQEPTRTELLCSRRPSMTQLEHPRYGTATIRDNGPLNTNKLAKALIDMTPSEFIRMINQKVFFWPTSRRLDTLLTSPAYRGRSHLVLTVDTESLVTAHGSRVMLSPINSGATVHNPPKRGSATFKTIAEFDFDYWKSKRSRSTAIAEVCVQYAIPDVNNHLIDATIRHPDGTSERI